MLGAIVGDIVGSRFEKNNIKTKDFDMFTTRSYFTDDTVMTLAIAKAILECNDNYMNLSSIALDEMVKLGRKYPNCGYEMKFEQWIKGNNHIPYNSFSNTAAMRVSACGLVAKSIEEAIDLSFKVTNVSHDHPEGLKGAEATCVAIYMANNGFSLDEIGEYINENYYSLNFTLDEIREDYTYSHSCQETVPQAIKAFLESNSFEDAIRNAISIGGDSDTIAAITGSIAEAYYGIPSDIRNEALEYLDDVLLDIVNMFEDKYSKKITI